jgi:glucan phosphoethanolaminetransferase (alkaline phosphatase superfamily)
LPAGRATSPQQNTPGTLLAFWASVVTSAQPSSSTDPSGYQVPFLFWTNHAEPAPASNDAVLEQREYRAGYLAHTLLGVLDIRTSFYQPEHEILSRQFTSSRGRFALR